MPSAKFSINGDAHGGLAAITQVKKGVHELSNELNRGIKNTIIEAFSIAASERL